VRTTERTGHAQRCLTLRSAYGLADFTGDHKAVAVLHDAMAHEAQESTDARGFLEQPGLVVTCGAVGRVGEQQAAEVTVGTFLAAV